MIFYWRFGVEDKKMAFSGTSKKVQSIKNKIETDCQCLVVRSKWCLVSGDGCKAWVVKKASARNAWRTLQYIFNPLLCRFGVWHSPSRFQRGSPCAYIKHIENSKTNSSKGSYSTRSICQLLAWMTILILRSFIAMSSACFCKPATEIIRFHLISRGL